jgi:hypothetical protein
MRQFTIGILSATALAAAIGLSYESSGKTGPSYYKIVAHPVTKQNLTALQGTFRMIKTSAGGGIPSNRIGGGCLVFAAADLGLSAMAGTSCTKNDDCKSSQSGNDGKPASAYYCHRQTRSCWARPGSDPFGKDTCNRPITMTPNVHNPAPVRPVDASKLGVKKGAHVRVVACLNKIPYPSTGAGCKAIDSTDRMEVFGPVANVK